MHNDGQIHASVNDAVDVKGTCGREGADFQRATFAVEVVQDWRAWLCRGHDRAAGGPGAVLQDMLNSGIVDEQQFGAFWEQALRSAQS